MNLDPLDTPLYLNGINAETGTYLAEPVPARKLIERVKRQSWKPEHWDDLRYRGQQRGAARSVLPEYGDGSDLSKTGWGIIFPAQADPAQVQAILEAMDCLIARRREQAGARLRIYRGRDGFRWVRGKPETKNSFLARNGAGVGPVNPERMPYYLLIVADPQSIPFQFQYELDVQYAVGRLYFHTLDDYAAYARSVVASETRQGQADPRAVFFGVSNSGDPATRMSAEELVAPLHRYVEEKSSAFHLCWRAEVIPPTQADRGMLLSLLGGARAPAFLLTASHGWSWQRPHPQQSRCQGALVCQDWQGPNVEKVTRAHVLAGEDIPDDHVLTGSVIFNFACFSAGTPYWEDTAEPAPLPRQPIATRPFLGALPTRLLSLPGGGALAVIGHVERAWSYAFHWGQLPSQTQSYQSLLFQLMQGKPVGLAMEQMNQRYAEIATMLAHDLSELRADPDAVDPLQLLFEWTAINDARSSVVLGDPAARIPTADEPASAAQPVSLRHFPGRLPLVFAPDALAPFLEDERQAILQEEAVTGAGTNAPLPDRPEQPAGQLERAADQPFTAGAKDPAEPQTVFDALQEKIAEVAQALETIEVRTCAEGDAECMLVTQIRPDGSMHTTFPPEGHATAHPELLQLHEALVRQAIERQIGLLKELNRLMGKDG